MTSTLDPSSDAAAALLEPVVDPVSAGFWSATARGELTVQTCLGCGAHRFPPSPMCPACHSVASAWRPVPGDGTVWSFVVPHPPLLPAYAELAPYVAAVVALDVDPSVRMVGRVVDAGGGPIEPDRVRVGDPVSVRFARHGAVHVPVWALAPTDQPADQPLHEHPEVSR